MKARSALRVRDLRREDLDAVVRVDAALTGQPKPDYWGEVFDRLLQEGKPGRIRIGLAVDEERSLAGYLLGEVRAFEFGSDACGWIFAVGVEARHLRTGVASGLLAEAARRFRAAGVRRMRTMVRRDDVPVLSFFRSNGFVGGSFVQLETDLDGEESR